MGRISKQKAKRLLLNANFNFNRDAQEMSAAEKDLISGLAKQWGILHEDASEREEDRLLDIDTKTQTK